MVSRFQQHFFYESGMSVYRTVDFILNDEATLSCYIASLATDVEKIGITWAVSWGLGALAMTFTTLGVGQ